MNSMTKNMQLLLKRVGGSLALIIPRDIVSLCDLEEGSKFEVVVEKNILTLKAEKR